MNGSQQPRPSRTEAISANRLRSSKSPARIPAILRFFATTVCDPRLPAPFAFPTHMNALVRASARCAAALLLALPFAPAHADGDDTALTNLIALVSQRLSLAEPVAHWKWEHHKPITDTPREDALLADVQKRASTAGVDPAFAHAFFRDQIDASTQVQKALFESWRTSQAPTGDAPDLATVMRPQLDRLTGQLIGALAQVQPLRASDDCPARLARSLANWKQLTRYDSARGEALNRALGHICEDGGPGGTA